MAAAKLDHRAVMEAVAELEHAERQTRVVNALAFVLYQLGIKSLPRHLLYNVENEVKMRASLQRTIDILGIRYRKP